LAGFSISLLIHLLPRLGETMFPQMTGGYAFGQQPVRPSNGALNWNPGYGPSGFMGGPLARPAVRRAGRGRPRAVNPNFVNAVAVGVREDEKDMNESMKRRLANIRMLQAFIQGLDETDMRERGLDLQEQRMMDE